MNYQNPYFYNYLNDNYHQQQYYPYYANIFNNLNNPLANEKFYRIHYPNSINLNSNTSTNNNLNVNINKLPTSVFTSAKTNINNVTDYQGEKASALLNSKQGERMNNKENIRLPSASKRIGQSVERTKVHYDNEPTGIRIPRKKTFTYNFNHLSPAEKAKLIAEYIRNKNDEATLILPSFMYLGGHKSVKDAAALEKQGITHVLNMAVELKLDTDDLNKRNIKLLHIAAKDAKTYNIRTDFDQAFQFIDDALRTRGKIIINCARGISRSATIVIAYLMFRYNMTLVNAYTFVARLRPQIRPNSNFRRILQVFEQELSYQRFRQRARAQSSFGRYQNHQQAHANTLRQTPVNSNFNRSTPVNFIYK